MLNSAKHLEVFSLVAKFLPWGKSFQPCVLQKTRQTDRERAQLYTAGSTNRATNTVLQHSRQGKEENQIRTKDSALCSYIETQERTQRKVLRELIIY